MNIKRLFERGNWEIKFDNSSWTVETKVTQGNFFRTMYEVFKTLVFDLD